MSDSTISGDDGLGSVLQGLEVAGSWSPGVALFPRDISWRDGHSSSSLHRRGAACGSILLLYYEQYRLYSYSSLMVRAGAHMGDLVSSERC